MKPKLNTLITGIRHNIRTELDLHQSALFMRYVMHFLEMFAFLGVIIPVLIGIDYFCPPKTKDEMIIDKFYKTMDNNYVEYHILTNTFHFLSDHAFFKNTNINDKVTLCHTPIFKHVTRSSYTSGTNIYVYEPDTIYWLPLIFLFCLTSILSVIFFIKTWNWKRKNFYRRKYDSTVNLGVAIAFLSIFIIVAILFKS